MLTVTDAEKISNIKILLSDGGTLPSDEKITAYLNLAKAEILSWLYHLVGGVPADVTEVPAKYDIVHIYSVVAGYTHAGSEGQSAHSENGIKRDFLTSDMVDYIHRNVFAIVRVGAVT